ncbi:MAG: hypothetical protein Q7J06_02500 [Bacteroidales bacterium]|nr:hypothetical protein [Bacteroidales bacterium]
MITKGELKTVEQETRLGWLGLLALTAKAYRFHFVTEGKKTLAPPVVVLLLANPDEAAGLCEAIQATGVSAGIAKNSQEACMLTADEKVKVFVVDEAFVKSASDCWQFRKDRILPIAVIGSSREREGWERVVNIEADGYLSKGTSLSEQAARIKAMLRRY